MKLIKDENGVYIAVCDFTEKDIAKGAGFKFNWDEKLWKTSDPMTAAKLANFADTEELKNELLEAGELRAKKLEESKATFADISIPAPAGLNYLPYQLAGINYAMQRQSSLIADEMGLGKTIQAIGVINADPTIKKVLVVCPASLKLNWFREMEKWIVRLPDAKLKMIVANGKTRFVDLAAAQIVIVNYDILAKLEILNNTTFDLLIADECHYAKNAKAKRSKALYAIKAKRRVFLTGTPITNRPAELFPIVNALDPVTFPKFFPFAFRYCNAHHNGYGWDFSGAANLEELQDKLRLSIMVRRLKSEVLKELPAKRRQIIEFEAEGMQGVLAAEKEVERRNAALIAELRARVELAKAGESLEEYERAVTALREARQVEFTEMARVRKETAIAKVPLVVSHIEDLIEDNPTYKVVVMCHHHAVVDRLMEAFRGKAVQLTGETPMAVRQANVDRFQDPDSGVQVFVGSIKAAGVGITLTASSHVVFAELDWVPANMAQAEDRVHRIGQENSVLIQMLVLEDSLDAKMAKTLAAKLKVIDKALDKSHDEYHVYTEAEAAEINQSAEERAEAKRRWLEEKEAAERERIEREEARDAMRREGLPATSRATRDQLVEAGKELAPDQIARIHAQLRFLANNCDGAIDRDGEGFNATDTHIGKFLAVLPSLTAPQAALGAIVIKKYAKQLAAMEVA